MSRKIPKTSTVIYGRNSVLERLRHNPSTIKEIFLRQGLDLQEIRNKAVSAGIAIREVNEKKLLKIKSTKDSQGVVACVEPFRYVPFEDLLLPPQGTIIFLDHIYDPQNLGVIMRSAACLAEASLVIARHDACEVTDAAVHVACGGENFVSVARVSSLSHAVREAKEGGYWIAGAVCEGGGNLTLNDLPFPLGVVMGTESGGIRPGLAKYLDYKFSIPMPGVKLSLNVAIAASIFCYEISRQRTKKKVGSFKR